MEGQETSQPPPTERKDGAALYKLFIGRVLLGVKSPVRRAHSTLLL